MRFNYWPFGLTLDPMTQSVPSPSRSPMRFLKHWLWAFTYQGEKSTKGYIERGNFFNKSFDIFGLKKVLSFFLLTKKWELFHLLIEEYFLHLVQFCFNKQKTILIGGVQGVLQPEQIQMISLKFSGLKPPWEKEPSRKRSTHG